MLRAVSKLVSRETRARAEREPRRARVSTRGTQAHHERHEREERSAIIASASTYAHVAAWSVIGLVFAAAAVQGSDFASTKQSASIWGGVIGLAAFFAWLAVDEEEGGDYEESDTDDEDGLEGTDASGPTQRKKPPGKLD